MELQLGGAAPKLRAPPTPRHPRICLGGLSSPAVNGCRAVRSRPSKTLSPGQRLLKSGKHLRAGPDPAGPQVCELVLRTGAAWPGVWGEAGAPGTSTDGRDHPVCPEADVGLGLQDASSLEVDAFGVRFQALFSQTRARRAGCTGLRGLGARVASRPGLRRRHSGQTCSGGSLYGACAYAVTKP